MPAYLVIADSGVTGNTKQAVHHVSTLQERIIDPTTNETGSDAVQSIGAIVQDTKTAIETKDPLKLGQLMTSNHDPLKKLGFLMISLKHSSVPLTKIMHSGQKSQVVA